MGVFPHTIPLIFNFKHDVCGDDRNEVNTSHYSSLIFIIFLVTKVLYIQKTKNQSLLAIWQTQLFFRVMIRWVMQRISFDFANMHHVFAGNFSAKPHVRFRCHIWIQYGPCITFLTFLIYVHSRFHLHSRDRVNGFEIRVL